MKTRGAKRTQIGIEQVEGRLLTTSLAMVAMSGPAVAEVQRTAGGAGARGDSLNVKFEDILVSSYAP